MTAKFCFDGIEKGKTVAVGTHGCIKKKDGKEHFKAGLSELVKRLCPKTIIVYEDNILERIELFIGNMAKRIFAQFE